MEVTHVAAKLDPSSFVDHLTELGAGSALPEGDYLDEAAKNRDLIERVLGEPEVDVYVGEDGILRGLTIAADLDLAALGAQAGGAGSGKVVLDARLSEVNEPQRIGAPKAISGRSLQDAFERSEGLNASGMVALGALMIQRPGLAGARADNFSFAELTAGAAPWTDNPQRAARAIEAHKKVVIFFHNPQGIDDRPLQRVLREVAGRTQAAVLSDHVDAVDRWRTQWDRFKLKIPMKIGDIVQKLALARFSRTLSGLIAAGVPMLEAIDITGRTSGNRVIEMAMEEVRESVKKGGSLTAPMAKVPEAFPVMVTQMLGVGEETGALEQMMTKVAEFYEDRVAAAINALTSILEPAMIVLVGAIVGFIVISMYLPMFKVYDAIK